MRRVIAVLAMFVVLAFAVLAAPVAARATTMQPEQKTCPVCTNEFEVWVVGSSNSFGGLDSDLFSQAAGENPVTVAVWTCPKCRFSASIRRFPKGVSAETAAKIREGLEPGAPIAASATQRQIPAWVQFDLAARILEMDGAPVAERAQLALQGAWAVRSEVWDALDGAHQAPAVAAGWKAAAARADALLDAGPETSIDGWDRAQATIRTARTILAEAAVASARGEDVSVTELYACHRLLTRGEGGIAAPVLERLVAPAGLPGGAPAGLPAGAPDEVRGAAERLLASVAHERAFQESYVRLVTESLAKDEYEATDRAAELWVVADTLRRLGRRDAARDGFLAAIDAGPPLWLFPKAKEMVAALGGVVPADRAETAWKRAVASEITRLADPDTAENASRRLRGTRSPDVVAGVVPCLTHESRIVRKSAAAALSDEWDPGDAALDALAKMMADDEVQALRAVAAKSLATIGSPRSGAAFLEEMQWSTDVRKIGVEALAATGEADAVPALLVLGAEKGVDVLRTVSLLTNRAHATADAAKTWHDAHAAEDRRTWVVGGFKEAGLPVPDDLWKAEHVPLLIGWLEDPRLHVRANAVRVLREITGQCFGWRRLADPWDAPRAVAERAIAVRTWRRWWKERPTESERK